MNKASYKRAWRKYRGMVAAPVCGREWPEVDAQGKSESVRAAAACVRSLDTVRVRQVIRACGLEW